MSQIEFLTKDMGMINLSRPEKLEWTQMKDYISADWIIQSKRDGVHVVYDSRIGLTRDGQKIYNDNFVAIYEELSGVIPKDTIIEGEIVVQTPTLSGQMIDNCGEASGMLNGKPKAKPRHAQFIAFDILKHKGKDVRKESYAIRHEMLDTIFKDWKHYRFATAQVIPNLNPKTIETDPEIVSELGLEGYIARDPVGTYNSTIYKFKAELEKDFKIVGWDSTATKEVGVIKVQTMDGVNAGNVNILPKFLQTFPPTELKKRFDSGKYTAIVRYMKHVGSETLRFPILVDIRYD